MRPLVWLALPPTGDQVVAQRPAAMRAVDDAPPTTAELVALVVARLSAEAARTGHASCLQLSADAHRVRCEVHAEGEAVAGGVVRLLATIAHRWGVTNEGDTRVVWFEVPLVPPVRYVAG